MWISGRGSPTGAIWPEGGIWLCLTIFGVVAAQVLGVLAYLVAGEAKDGTKQTTGHGAGLRGKLQIANLASKGWVALRLDRSSSVKPRRVPTGCGRFAIPRAPTAAMRIHQGPTRAAEAT